jgi:hypothetical protein
MSGEVVRFNVMEEHYLKCTEDWTATLSLIAPLVCCCLALEYSSVSNSQNK